MSTAFESSLARLNAAVQGRLTNADAVLDNVPTRVIFDNGYADPQGIATRMPRACLPSAQAARVTQASVLRLVGGATYRVTSVQPDGTGWTELQLERQP